MASNSNNATVAATNQGNHDGSSNDKSPCKTFSTTQTQLSASSIVLGTSVTDTATVKGVSVSQTPKGTVDFSVSFNGGKWVVYDSCVKLVNGVAVSQSYTPKAAGSYEFQASYSGDCNFYPSQSMKCSELLCVSKACPVATTAIGASEIMMGQSVTDNVTVTGLGVGFPCPTGLVIFQVSFNNGPWMNIGNAVVLHNGQATSCFYEPAAEGSYSFQAIYLGDCNYHGATSAAGSEILTVDQVPVVAADPSESCIVTDLGTTQIVLGSSVMDNATITAADGSPVCGTVDFSVSYNGGPFVVYDHNEKVVNGMASSKFFTADATGNYRFIACYSGSNTVLSSVSGENCEKLTVCQAPSSTATCLSQTSIKCGATVYDTAYVTGIAGFVLPSGTVTFSVSCDDGKTWKQIGAPVALVNGKATSAVYNPCVAGTYEFQASYSGDCNYLASADCPCSEILTVSGEFWSITLGESVTDNATVTGLAGFPCPTGYVDFQYSYEHGCWTTYTCHVALVNGQAVSGWFTPLATGHYNFRAVYSGDNNYNPSVSGSCEEPMFVCPAPSSTSTQLSSSDIVLGHCVTDTAFVQGLCGDFPCPTGTVTFQYSYEGSAWKNYSVDVDVANCKATSAPFVPLAAGCYEFRAIYSGDCNYVTSVSLPHTELLTVERAPSSASTSLGTDTIVLGQSVQDNVTVLGVGPCFPTPTGPVSFQVSYEGGKWIEYSTAMLDCNGKATGGFYTPLAAGHYQFRVVYSCDNNYLESISAQDTEPLLVDPACSQTSTMLSQSDIVLGNSVYDQVAVCGLGGDFPVPTGTVNFQVSNNGGCSWYVFESCVPLVDGKATSVCYTPHAAGNYLFQAVYSGDANYNPSQSYLLSEPLCVERAPSYTSTCLGTADITLGQSVTDNVTVCNGLGSCFPTPTGPVQFQYRAVGGNWIAYDNETLDCNGHATSTWFTPMSAGCYEFRAVYSCDSNYLESSSLEHSEPLTVERAGSTTTTDLGL